MAGKKGAMKVQEEVRSDEDWELLLQKKGLVVIDVFSQWCGPCVPMVSLLKKMKNDFGDFMTLAIAESDSVTALERFRTKSEPTWMILGSGNMVNVFFGCDFPTLSLMITKEFNQEWQVVAGRATRVVIPFGELAPEEMVRLEATEEIRLQKQATEDAEIARIAAEERSNLIPKVLNYSVLMLLPYLYDEEGNCEALIELMEKLAPLGFTFFLTKEVDPEEEMVVKLICGDDEDAMQKYNEMLEEFPEMKVLVRMLERKDIPDYGLPVGSDVALERPLDCLENLVEAVYGAPPPVDENQVQCIDLESIINMYTAEWGIPAMWTPGNDDVKAGALLHFFPEFCEPFNETPPVPPPPQYVMMFPPELWFDIEPIYEEHRAFIIQLGYFDGMNPKKANKICNTYEDYLKRSVLLQTGEECLTCVINRSSSKTFLAFYDLKPVYVSSNSEVGLEEALELFPPSDGEEEGEEEDEEEGDEETEDEGWEEGMDEEEDWEEQTDEEVWGEMGEEEGDEYMPEEEQPQTGGFEPPAEEPASGEPLPEEQPSGKVSETQQEALPAPEEGSPAQEEAPPAPDEASPAPEGDPLDQEGAPPAPEEAPPAVEEAPEDAPPVPEDAPTVPEDAPPAPEEAPPEE